jgi:O-antigen ligase
MGGGFEFWSPQSFLIYSPNPLDFHDAHSIYFEVLGEHGYGGLILFLLFGISAFLIARSVIKQTRNIEYFAWANLLARMIQVSLVAYVMGGSFLGLAYADIGYQLVAILIVLQLLVRQGAPELDAEQQQSVVADHSVEDFIRKPLHQPILTAQQKAHDKTTFIR